MNFENRSYSFQLFFLGSKNSPTKDPAWLTGGRNQPTENNTDNKAPAATPKVLPLFCYLRTFQLDSD